METDYSKITVADFESTVKNYAIFQLLGSALSNKEEDSADD
jgi:hypothetical protein